MKLELNKTANDTRINEGVKNALNQISNNLENGRETTELYIDKDIGYKVREKLDEEFKKQGKEDNFIWCVVRRSPNQFTGAMQSFTGDTIGDEKYYKLKYIER